MALNSSVVVDTLYVVPTAGASRAAWLCARLCGLGADRLLVLHVASPADLPPSLIEANMGLPRTLPLLACADGLVLETGPVICRFLAMRAGATDLYLGEDMSEVAEAPTSPRSARLPAPRPVSASPALARQAQIDAILDWSSRVLHPALTRAVTARLFPAVFGDSATDAAAAAADFGRCLDFVERCLHDSQAERHAEGRGHPSSSLPSFTCLCDGIPTLADIVVATALVCRFQYVLVYC